MDHAAHAKPIPGYGGEYLVCPCGIVLSMKRGKARQLASFPRDRTGHHAVNLCRPGEMKTMALSRLVAAAFLPPPGPGEDLVRHRDDNPANNAAENLLWGTNADNSADMTSRGRQSGAALELSRSGRWRENSG